MFATPKTGKLFFDYGVFSLNNQSGKQFCCLKIQVQRHERMVGIEERALG